MTPTPAAPTADVKGRQSLTAAAVAAVTVRPLSTEDVRGTGQSRGREELFGRSLPPLVLPALVRVCNEQLCFFCYFFVCL